MKGPAVEIDKHKHAMLLNQDSSLVCGHAWANFYYCQLHSHFTFPSCVVSCTHRVIQPQTKAASCRRDHKIPGMREITTALTAFECAKTARLMRCAVAWASQSLDT